MSSAMMHRAGRLLQLPRHYLAAAEYSLCVSVAGNRERTIIYTAFTPAGNPDNIAPRHLIFSRRGTDIRKDGALPFLNPIMKRRATARGRGARERNGK